MHAFEVRRSLDEEQRRITTDLTAEMAGRVAPQEVERVVADSFHSFDGSKIELFVPVLARRRARRALGIPGLA
jgi:hypothetical protein